VERASVSIPIGLVIETPENRRETDPVREIHPMERRVALFLATGGGAGQAPIAPGTAGSAVGVLVYLPLASLGLTLYGLTVLGLVFLGIWAADVAERVFERKDDGRIVIDEIVGQLLTLAPLVILAPRVDLRSPAWLVTGFVLFRWLDIWKPGPARWAEQNFRGGAGVVLDDVVAGVLAAVLLGAGVLAVEGMPGG
jgi:phosphatidylglycerophosphatase A